MRRALGAEGMLLCRAEAVCAGQGEIQDGCAGGGRAGGSGQDEGEADCQGRECQSL